MHRNNNIFYKTVSEDENHLTELFCNLLKYDYIRYFFLKFFNKEGVLIPHENILYENINTQKKISSGKQPDIIIKTHDYLCFFEIKIKNSTLQDSQVNEYIHELEKNKNWNMIYFVPKNYFFLYEIKKITEAKHQANYYFWQDFLKYIQDSDLFRSNILVYEFVVFAKQVLAVSDVCYTLNLKEMALLQNPYDLVVARSLNQKLEKIVDECSVIIQEKYKLESEKPENGNELEYAYYFYFKDQDNYLLYFGLWYDLVFKNKAMIDYLLCCGVNTKNEGTDEIYDEKYVTMFQKIEPIQEMKEYNGYLLRKVTDNYTFAHDDSKKIIEEITNNLCRIIENLINK